jgi:hypothetical protein
MPLDTGTLSRIYQKLIPILGEEDANALMSQFRVGPATTPAVRPAVPEERPPGSASD